MAFAVHKFFQENGFYYINTPILTSNDAEGAGETFQVTTLDLDGIAQNGKKVNYDYDFFGAPTNLAVSGQLQGEIMASAIGDIYTFGPTFRAEKSNTSRHLSEFWMIEPEMAFANLSEDVKVAENFLKYLCQYALDNASEEMELFNKFVDKTHTRIKTLEDIVKSDFETITYTEAISILERKSKKAKFEFPVKWGIDLQSEHERYLTERHFKKPIAVIDYPKDIKAFYMRLNDDNKTVAAMDVLVPQIGEIIGGSERENRFDYLERAMIAQNIPMDEEHGLWWYKELRKYGSVPHAGFGLGFARMLMYMSGISNVRDIIPFPRTPKNSKF
jgi:asparaginyl-tRNA synthetase